MPRLLIAVASLAACTPYDPSLGAAPFFCGQTDPKCPDGYTCVAEMANMVCVKGLPDGGASGTCTMAFDGVLATWDFTGQPGSQATTAAASSAPGVVAAPITRAPALMASPAAGSISAANWPMGTALDTMSYFSLSLTPPAGCTLAAKSMSVDAKSSTTGPTMAALGTSVDSFAGTISIATTAPSTPTLTASTTDKLEIRIYGYGATATGGTLRLQNQLTVSGALR